MKGVLLVCTLAASFAMVGSVRADQFTLTITPMDSVGKPATTPVGSVIIDATETGEAGLFWLTGVEPGSSIDLGSGPLAVTAAGPGTFYDPKDFSPNYQYIFSEGSGVTFTLSDGESIFIYDQFLYDGLYEEDSALINGGDTIHRITHSLSPVPPAESTSPVPEPSSIVLVGTSLLGLIGTLRKRFLA